jgi:hypothetical protein
MEQCASMSCAQLRQGIPSDGGLTTAHKGKHRMWGGVAVLRARRSHQRRALAVVMAYSGEAGRRVRAELAVLLQLRGENQEG